MRVLWIDDEIDMFRPFVYALKDKGYEVETATNGPDGIELVKTRDFDLVLLDEIMTGMDGLEVLRRLKQLDPNLLVAMVTKSDQEALINEAFGKLSSSRSRPCSCSRSSSACSRRSGSCRAASRRSTWRQ